MVLETTDSTVPPRLAAEMSGGERGEVQPGPGIPMAEPVTRTGGKPIFILGITTRSGTGFLRNLVKIHPDTRVPEPIWEDYLLEPSHLLLKYVESVYGWWEAGKEWGVDPAAKGRLCRSIGRGLISFLESQAGVGPGERLLTKTPSVSHLENFFHLFPDAYLLIIVRDGRDVVESTVRSFGEWSEGVAVRWAEGAETILRFDRANRKRNLRYRIVRYEDLYSNVDEYLPPIIDFLDLDPARYDFNTARQLPIRGSSTYRRKDTEVDWRNPVARTLAFKPIGRWKDWDRRMHERFNWIAGEYQVELGYSIRSFSEHRRVWDTYNSLVDAVAKYKLSQLVPSFVWRPIRRVGYRVFRSVGVDAYQESREATRTGMTDG